MQLLSQMQPYYRFCFSCILSCCNYNLARCLHCQSHPTHAPTRIAFGIQSGGGVNSPPRPPGVSPITTQHPLPPRPHRISASSLTNQAQPLTMKRRPGDRRQQDEYCLPSHPPCTRRRVVVRSRGSRRDMEVGVVYFL